MVSTWAAELTSGISYAAKSIQCTPPHGIKRSSKLSSRSTAPASVLVALPQRVQVCGVTLDPRAPRVRGASVALILHRAEASWKRQIGYSTIRGPRLVKKQWLHDQLDL